MATCSSTLAWNIPWTEEPGRLLSMGLQRIGKLFACKELAEHTHHQPAISLLDIYPKELKAGT